MRVSGKEMIHDADKNMLGNMLMIVQGRKLYPRGGGGGTLNFSAYIGSASALHPKKMSGISSTPKNI